MQVIPRTSHDRQCDILNPGMGQWAMPHQATDAVRSAALRCVRQILLAAVLLLSVSDSLPATITRYAQAVRLRPSQSE